MRTFQGVYFRMVTFSMLDLGANELASFVSQGCKWHLISIRYTGCGIDSICKEMPPKRSKNKIPLINITLRNLRWDFSGSSAADRRDSRQKVAQNRIVLRLRTGQCLRRTSVHPAIDPHFLTCFLYPELSTLTLYKNKKCKTDITFSASTFSCFA